MSEPTFDHGCVAVYESRIAKLFDDRFMVVTQETDEH